MNMKIAWVVPTSPEGSSGGVQTVCRHAMHLQKLGAECHFFVLQIPGERDVAQLEQDYARYGCQGIVIHPSPCIEGDFQIGIATLFLTVPYVRDSSCKEKFYFVQDFEPLFEPMGDTRIQALQSYKQGLTPVTIGNWLASKLQDQFSTTAYITSFCANSSTYSDKHETRAKSICMLLQPEKPRRCSELVLETARLISACRPDISIYLYGSNVRPPEIDSVTHMKVLSKQQCCDLYNTCSAGLCISSSNPSRIPFEMMACGLPVVDIFAENNLYDFPNDAALLADPSPDALAAALLKIVDTPKLQEQMSAAGKAFMRTRPIQLELDQFAGHILGGSKASIAFKPPKKTYTREPITGSDSLRAKLSEIRRTERARLWKENEPIASPYINLTIRELPQGARVENGRAFIWKNADQSDLVEIPMMLEADGKLQGTLAMASFEDAPGYYTIHVYASVNGTYGVIARAQRRLGTKEPKEFGGTGQEAGHQEPLPECKIILSAASAPAANEENGNREEEKPAGALSAFRHLLRRR